jgi:RHS repeat-associated protein
MAIARSTGISLRTRKLLQQINRSRIFSSALRPVVEALEERQLLSFTVTTLDDTTLSGSLRYAITQANTAGGNQTITFASGLSGTIDLSSQLPSLTANISINGPGASSVAIDGQDDTGTIFTVSSGVTAGISGITIEGGNSTSSPGGGIYNAGTLTISNSTVTGNSATNGAGGIDNDGTMGITNCVISVNSAGANGGGIENGGTLVMSGSTLSANSSSDGGGIYVGSGSVTVANSLFFENDASAGGGLLINSGSVIIQTSEFTDNTSSGSSGAGGAIAAIGPLTISNCTLEGNSAEDWGGAIATTGSCTIIDSTIDDNSASSGGGLWIFGGTTLDGSIVANNTGGDISLFSLGSVSGSYDLVGDGSGSTGLTDSQTGTTSDPLDPDLGSLTENGGPTETMLPETGSPAIGNGAVFSAADGVDQRGVGRPTSNVDIGAVQTFTAPSITATTSSGDGLITWTALTNSGVSYNLYRSITSGGEGTTPFVSGLTGTSYTDTTTSAGLTYYYTLSAVDAGITTAQSSQASVTLLPSAPASLSAVGGTDQVSLSWSSVVGASSYSIYRGTTSGGETSVSSVAGTTSFTDTGLSSGTDFYYEVTAVDAAGESTKSNEANAYTVPAAPTGVTATGGNDQVALSWSASTGATSYNIYRGTSSGGETSLTSVTGATSYTDSSGLSSGTNYYYEVTAVDSAGESGYSSEASATTDQATLSTPTITSVSASGDYITITWTDSADIRTGFEIEVEDQQNPDDTGPDTNYYLVGNASSTATSATISASYNDINLSDDLSFRVRAMAPGESQYSTPQDFQEGENVSSSFPGASNLQAVDTTYPGGNSEYVTFDEPSPSEAPAGYVYERPEAQYESSDCNFGGWADDGTVDNGNIGDGVYEGAAGDGLELAWPDMTVRVRISYYDSTTQQYGYSEWSTISFENNAPAQIVAPQVSVSSLGDGAYQLSYSGNDLVYIFETPNAKVNTDNTGCRTVAELGVPSGVTSATVTCPTGLILVSQGGSDDGVSPLTILAEGSGTTLPAAPQNLTATLQSNNNKNYVNLLWDNTPNNESEFDVLWSASEAGPFTNTLGTTSADSPQLVDTRGLNPGQQMFYEVVATNSAGESSPSNVASVIIPAAPQCSCENNGLNPDNGTPGTNSSGLDSDDTGTGNGGGGNNSADFDGITGDQDTSNTGFGGGAGAAGNETSSADFPSLYQDSSSGATVVSQDNSQSWFDPAEDGSGSFTARYGVLNQLSYNSSSDIYTLTNTDGTQTTFYGFGGSVPVAQQGQIDTMTSADGNVTTTAYDDNGNLTEVDQTETIGTVTTLLSYMYSYLPSTDPNAGLLASLTQEQKTYDSSLGQNADNTSYSAVRAVDYAYYTDGSVGGNAGELATQTVTDGSGNVIDEQMYRYYTPGDPNGYAGALKYVFSSTSYEQLAANVSDPLTASDADIAPYADDYYEYNSDGQVSVQVAQGQGCSTCSGGEGTYTYSYAYSNNAAGYNSWNSVTTQTQPDGNENIYFYNAYGQEMLSIYNDVTTGQMTGTYTRYDDNGNVIMTAQPSAVNLPPSLATIEQYPDLLHQTGTSESGEPIFEYLNANSGQISLTNYYTATTATDTTPGGVAEYEENSELQQGNEGTPVLQESMTYYAQTGGGSTVYPEATDTTYRNTDGTGAETTTYSYNWYSDSTEMESQSTTLPTVSTSQNGPPSGSADVSTDVYDQEGRVIWSMDADGNITYNAYDSATGALIKTIQDVNTADTSDFDTSTLPSGWSTRTGAGLNLITTYQVDDLGRTIEETDPEGNVTYTTYDDPDHETRTYPGWHQDATTGLWTTTGPVQMTRDDTANGYTETLTYAYTPASGVSVPTGTETPSNLQSLTRDYMNDAQQVVREDQYFDLSGVTYSTALYIGTQNTNYYTTTYAYDTDGNQCKVVDPTGTITRTVYDGQHRVTSTWVGTDDTPTTGYWSPTNTAGSNMVEVSSDIYDNGGVGDGNLTETIQYPGEGEAARATLNYYDWQDRLVASKQGALVNSDGSSDPSAETDGVGRPITYTTYDNLGEAVEQQSYDGDGVTITSTDGVPSAPAADLLVAQSITIYDDQGRAYETEQYSVNPATGSVSSAGETSQAFYDPDGNVIAQCTPQGLWTKTAYDGMNRPTAVYTTDGGLVHGPLPGYAGASSINYDIVLSETDTTYDADGNTIETIEKDRLPTASRSTYGALTSSDARISYSGSWFDAVGRDVADENVGTNGGTAWTRPSSPDASDATHLVTTYGYDAAGNEDTVTDPAGIVTQTYFDALGRQTETIADYTDGTPTDSSNQTTEYTYDGDGDILTQTAVEPAGTPNQTTAYIYGATSGVFSKTLLSKVEYPDATTGTASTSASSDVSYSYDALGEKIGMTDQNGTTHQYNYDSLGRQTLDAVTTLGTGVDGSVLALGTTYNAQGLPFQETSYSDSAATTVVNQDEDVYNGLGQLTGEYQSVSGAVTVGTTPEVQYGYSNLGLGSRLTSMTYPNGRVLDYAYASGIDYYIGRVSGIFDAGGSDAGLLQVYNFSSTYLGLDTIVTELDGNGVTETTTLDNFGRTSELKYVNSSSVTTDDFQYGYDQDGNVLYQLNGLNGTISQLYTYDSLNRLTSYTQGTLSDDNTSITGTPTASQTYTYDALGNQETVSTNGTATTNTTNSKNELTASGGSSLAYDNDGNTLTDENGQTYTYNAWNQMVSAKSAAGATLATYTYDAQGRRITDTEGGATTEIYYDNQWQNIEERQGGMVARQNVWGLGYVNQLVERDDNSTNGNLGVSGSGLGERLYAQQDLNWSVVSLVDASGNVVQRATFTPYGEATFLTPSWSTTSDAYSVTVLFQGGRLDTATGLYNFQARDYDPQSGTWKEQDPAGYVGGINLYEFAMSAPIDIQDPTGMWGQIDFGDGITAVQAAMLKIALIHSGLRAVTVYGEVISSKMWVGIAEADAKCPSCDKLFQKLLDDLDTLGSILLKMIDLANLKAYDIEFSVGSLNANVDALSDWTLWSQAWDGASWTDFPNSGTVWTEFGQNQLNQSQDYLNELVFHELTHFGNGDDYVANDFSNSEVVEYLSQESLSEFQPFRVDVQNILNCLDKNNPNDPNFAKAKGILNGLLKYTKGKSY